ncbi:MAG: CHAT domain-containing protein [Microcoleus sp. PH2017_05_CCC_O_A]|nr:CHAT domain-containing protein [Microcoleus sp. PH2017_05_CCC_O_A]
MAADGEQNAGFLQQLAGQISQALGQGTQGGNADRDSAYLQLINALLSCPNGEEPQILSANSEFLDLGFMQACEAVAASLAEQGEETQANYLRNLASQVGEFLGFTSYRDNDVENKSPDDYEGFLQLLLKTEYDNFGGDSRHIYAVLQANLDKLNLKLIPVIQETMTGFMGGINDPKQAEIFAGLIGNIAIKISNFPRGSRDENLEIAIAFYTATLEVYTREAFPENWARTQNNLGLAYRNRIRGERADNIENAIRFHTAALEVLTREVFPQDWAMMQNSLGNAYSNRIRGERADNIQRAIAFYTAALEVLTRKAFPEDWAMTQNNLAIAYYSRIKGERADNIERAIASYTVALEVYTREAFPEDWARTQNNLGNAHSKRIRGERADNIEQAITFYTAALEVRTREAFPQDWAQTQNNLANAYLYRIKGKRADNIEQAIAFYTAALEVYTSEAFPEDWAGAQNNLASAYLYRIKGERADNLEQAIAFYTAALEVYTSEAFPEDWAQTQNNLGNAYYSRIKGERADNLEQAIAFCTAALEVYTREAFPQDWAQTQNNLANAYGDRIKGKQADNLEQAIASYTAALEVLTREAFPQDWATTQNNLGNAYSNRIRGERADNLEQAIASYTAALAVRSRKAFPEDWAQTQNNLGTAYYCRIRKDRADNIKRAISYFSAALEFYSRESFPINHAETLLNLGLAYRKVPNLQLASDTFANAINTVEFLRSEIHSGDETKQKLAEEWNKLYRNMVEVCIELKNYTAAIEYAERSKARNLVELLATRDLYPKGDIPETVLNELSRLRREIDAEQRRLDIEQTNRNSNGRTISGERSPQIDNIQSTIPDQTNLIQLRKQLDKLIAQDITPIDPDFALTQEVKGISYSEIQSLTAENTAILQWYITSDRLLAFIITPESPTPIVWQSSKTDFKALENWFNEYLKDYQENKTQWQQNLASRLQSLADILHLNDLLGRVAKKCDRLILIPHRFLHLLPLHALPVSREIWQRFNSETPSPEPTNPCPLDCFKQLPFTDIEVPAIRQNFPPENQDILIQNNALKSVINDSRLRIAHCAHFSCHGYFNFQQPLLSALLLADSELPPPAPAESNPNRYQPLKNGNILDLDKCLTLADIFALDFRECRLVVLSACETGISDFSSISDEYISLPSGFLVAGSSSVVPTLWAVNDLSTSLLMIKFYQNLKAGLSVALALNKAQLWLRDVTVEKLQQWTSKLSIRPSLKEDLYDMLDHVDSTEQPPFRSHYHWAAFCATGQ